MPSQKLPFLCSVYPDGVTASNFLLTHALHVLSSLHKPQYCNVYVLLSLPGTEIRHKGRCSKPSYDLSKNVFVLYPYSNEIFQIILYMEMLFFLCTLFDAIVGRTN